MLVLSCQIKFSWLLHQDIVPLDLEIILTLFALLQVKASELSQDPLGQSPDGIEVQFVENPDLVIAD